MQGMPKDEGHGMAMTIRCKKCSRPVDIDVTDAQIVAWRHGALIQKAMPNVTAEKREMFISGICPICWDEMFKEKDEW